MTAVLTTATHEAPTTPATITTTSTNYAGEVYEVWTGPDGSVVRRVLTSAQGVVLADSHYRDARLHREDGPAMTVRRESGVLKTVEWYIDGKLSRIGGPAKVSCRISGTPMYHEWYIDGLAHRLDGPAIELLHPDGSIEVGEWWAWGESYAEFGPIAERLARATEEELRKDFARSSYAVLLDEGIEARKIAEALADGVVTVDGIRAVLAGSPAEWVRAFESGVTA